MADKSRHAFGNSSGIENAIQNNLIDAYDILFLDGDTDPKIGWLDKNGTLRVVDNECVITVDGDTLPDTGTAGKIYICGGEAYLWNGSEFTPISKSADLTDLENQVSELETQIGQKADVETVETMIKEYADSATEVIEF